MPCFSPLEMFLWEDTGKDICTMVLDVQNLKGHVNFMPWWVSAGTPCPEGLGRLWASCWESPKLFDAALFCSGSFNGLDKDFTPLNVSDSV